ncbi:energy transducer TonB [Thermoflexibacter ruber]|uniref:TonB family C-terminal domain-containing protein n=1 Tax=Thermoflexibacter ruber TaxID=1003 RepID=A0A1I2CMW9_9BACT|nr:energy transducer TonB [Thermoflexibacter ruber]SFE69661.1 TonB family C-terminal domain-containing protein [Thermoflexibacter ruber]
MIAYIFFGAFITLIFLFFFARYRREKWLDSQEQELERNPEAIFTIVSKNAEPIGGLKEMYQFFKANLHYPEQAKEEGIAGRVYIEFIVEKDGVLSNLYAIRTIGAGCEEEAIRLIQAYGSWTPAEIRGKIVRQRMIIPIIFKLKN